MVYLNLIESGLVESYQTEILIQPFVFGLWTLARFTETHLTTVSVKVDPVHSNLIELIST